MSKSVQRINAIRKLGLPTFSHYKTFVRPLFDYCDEFLKFRRWFRKLCFFARLENLVYQNNPYINFTI